MGTTLLLVVGPVVSRSPSLISPPPPHLRPLVVLVLGYFSSRTCVHSNNVVTHLVRSTVDIEDSDGTEISGNAFSGNDNGAHFV